MRPRTPVIVTTTPHSPWLSPNDANPPSSTTQKFAIARPAGSSRTLLTVSAASEIARSEPALIDAINCDATTRADSARSKITKEIPLLVGDYWDDCSNYGHGVNFRELQDVIDATYGDRDRERGVAPTVAWLCEELGELAQAVRKGTPAEVEHEFSDVLAWIATLANQVGVDLTEVVDRYKDGCPKCSAIPCEC